MVGRVVGTGGWRRAEGGREGRFGVVGWLVGDALPLSFNIVLSHAIVLAPIPEQKPVGQDRAAGRPHTMPSIFIDGHNNPRGREEGRCVCRRGRGRSLKLPFLLHPVYLSYPGSNPRPASPPLPSPPLPTHPTRPELS